jgi:hypothetical protein
METNTRDEAQNPVQEGQRRLREALSRNEDVHIDRDGTLRETTDNTPALTVPQGKLAAGLYWYDRRPELWRGEHEVMRRHYPRFQYEVLSDGRLAWNGKIRPGGELGEWWHIMLVYEHNHPSRNTYGGSIHVYAVDPDLNDLERKFGDLPHTYHDGDGNLVICSNSTDDFKDTNGCTSSAASVIGWAAKWIFKCEQWLSGEITKAQFADHSM